MFFNKKKRFIKKIIKKTELDIWLEELDKFGLLQQRETMRQQYDQSIQALEAIKARVDAVPPTEVVDDKLKENKQQVEKVVATLRGNLEEIDSRISEVTNKLQSSVEKKALVDSFIKYNC